MKSAFFRHTLRLTLVLGILVWFAVGCSSGKSFPHRHFAYLDEPAHATLTGHIDGMAFAAELWWGGEMNVAEAADAPIARLIFTEPSTLCGVEIQRAANSEVTAALGELHSPCTTEGMGMLIELICTEQSVLSCRTDTQNDTLCVELEDGACLLLDTKEARPLQFKKTANGRAIEIVVTDWQTAE